MTTTTTTTTTAPTQTHWLAPSSKTDGGDANVLREIDCLTVGTGRFLRSVLVPALSSARYKTALIQTRGTSFLEYMQQEGSGNQQHPNCYAVDTVLGTGEIRTDWIPCSGAFSMGSVEHRRALLEECLPKMNLSHMHILGVGVTEAGLASSDTPVMKHLYELLRRLYELRGAGSSDDKSTAQKLCVINMDNVPSNGSVLRSHMLDRARSDEDVSSSEQMLRFMETRVVFLNTMVDRITSHRVNDAMIPRAEPVPAKALVILDPDGDLPEGFTANIKPEYGVVIRRTRQQFDADLQLKLRVANGTHTAVAHVMALSGMLKTDLLAQGSDKDGGGHAIRSEYLMEYLDALFHDQIAKAGVGSVLEPNAAETAAVYEDWRARLRHAHFGLSTFFITQNGAAKGGIRLGPTVVDLMTRREPVTVSTAFAFAALLRWLTPRSCSGKPGICRGWLDRRDDAAAVADDNDNGGDPNKEEENSVVEYADGLRYNLGEGWYEFKCACRISLKGERPKSVGARLAAVTGGGGEEGQQRPQQPAAYASAIAAYLRAPDGGRLESAALEYPEPFDELVSAVATLYARAVAGDQLLDLLQEMVQKQHVYSEHGLSAPCSVLVDGNGDSSSKPHQRGNHLLHYRPCPIPPTSALYKRRAEVTDAHSLDAVVTSEVAACPVIDLHTHLLPPQHGATLCLWGIDELLTYHYLVAEYFMTAPADVSPEGFYAKTKQQQADLIWQALFLDRSPVSEACRGVVTTLQALGLHEQVRKRDLEGIRSFYRAYRDRGVEGAQEFSDLVFRKSGVRYNVMTNIPFVPAEVQHWRGPARKEYDREHYKTALRVDPFLAGDAETIWSALAAAGYERTLRGAKDFMNDWCDTMQPEYVMASTPHNFVFSDDGGGTLANVAKTGINEEAMKQPGAFAEVTTVPSATAGGNNCDGGVQEDTPSVVDEGSDFLSEVLMKVCEERDLPVALKIGCHRGINPPLRSAGDGMVAFADATVLARLCARFPKVRFLATFLSRNNQHEACVLANKFRNLHIYGCWWYCNNPSIIREVTAMRVEMLGTAFTSQHSDARVLDQLLYKWPHSRAVIRNVLVEEWTKSIESGWTPTRGEIRRDVRRLFGGSYEEFMAKSFTSA